MNPDTVKIGLDPTNPRRQNVDFFLNSSDMYEPHLCNVSSGNPQIRMVRITTLRNYKHAA
jgi:hypothetical protein